MRCRGIEFGRVYGRLRLILVIFLVVNPVRPPWLAQSVGAGSAAVLQ